MAIKTLTSTKYLFAIILALSLLGCIAEAKGAQRIESIGSAKMLSDGVIELQLRAEGSDGAVGDALIYIKPDNPKYAEIKRHVGDLKPGEVKPVPPWPKN